MAKVSDRDQAEGMRRLFARIAHCYDLGNRIISLGQDRAWRKLALAPAPRDGLVLDIATGTGEMALDLARGGSKVVGVDLSQEMLSRCRAKLSRKRLQPMIDLLQADALALPFADETFDCATVGFAMRNVDSIPACFAELRRVLKAGGRVICLELTTPRGRLVARLHRLYLQRALPFVGRLLGRKEEYIYLANSLVHFPMAGELKRIMEQAGLSQVTYRLLNLGTVAIHTGRK
ncbi:MAG: ubiquinone/menaquinone biosynthesis methyltransferase [Dehalococcoidia bacterium]